MPQAPKLPFGLRHGTWLGAKAASERHATVRSELLLGRLLALPTGAEHVGTRAEARHHEVEQRLVLPQYLHVAAHHHLVARPFVEQGVHLYVLVERQHVHEELLGSVGRMFHTLGPHRVVVHLGVELQDEGAEGPKHAMGDQHTRHQHEGFEVHAHARQCSAGRRAPYRGRRVESPHGESLLQDQSATQEANARHNLRRDARGVARATRRHGDRQYGEGGRSHRHKHVGTQACAMLAILSLHADERAHEEGAARSHYKVNQRNHSFMF